MAQCILLNADYSFLNVVEWKRALRLIINNKVRVLKYSSHYIKGAQGLIIRIPAVMRLVRLIRSIYRSRVPFSKRNVLIRDGFVCVYCGEHHGKMTIDHIIPKSQGGGSSFENCVACCRTCNVSKGNRTPSEARMFLQKRPFQPTISEFMRFKLIRLNLGELWDHLEENSEIKFQDKAG